MIIFGSGKIGRKALSFLGEKNIECFCDNNLKLIGTVQYNKRVISFHELKEIYHDAIIVIAVGEIDSFSIAKQCEENGILDYVVYKFALELFPDWEQRQLLDFLLDPQNRIFLRQDMRYREIKALRDQVTTLQRQIDYFKTHVDIQHMKPAKGKLRTRQLELVQVSVEFFDKISFLGISPILYGGNLLGYVRNNGFIPWDDDMDFALIRDEYEKLKEYCRMHIYDEYEFCDKKASKRKKIVAPELENYYWCERYHFLGVAKVLSDGRAIGIDFFSLDYYADDCEFYQLKEYAAQYREKLSSLESLEEKIQYTNKTMLENKQNSVKQSNHIFWGLDNMEFTQSQYPREQFIPANVIFPLQKALFEGQYFWIPNDAEELAKYEFGDIWKFPDDVGILRHCSVDEE